MVRGIIHTGLSVGKSEMLSSQLFEFERSRREASTICIKYVLSGEENYQVNNDVYTITSGNYLLIDRQSNYTTFLTPKQLNEGLCLYIDQGMIQDVTFTLSNKEERCLDNDYREYPTNLDITEGLYRNQESDFGQRLAAIGTTLQQNDGKLDSCSSEQFYHLVEQFVFTQKRISKKVESIGAKKPAVQKELFRRVEEGRKYIADNLGKDLSIDEIAGNAHLSPFHFMRTFKQVHAISTYQYILEKRLEKAFTLNQCGQYSITDIAMHCGFNDIFTFSKAFKRKYGHSPRHLHSLRPEQVCN